MRIGVDYYPEQWNRELWEEDICRMKEAGVTTIRIGEFAWCRMEPTEGNYEFDWLDDCINLCQKYKIEVVLCTPTNCPPLWLYEQYEEAIQVDSIGHRIPIGIRGHRCYNSPVFLKFSERIIRKLAERYANNPVVIGWQIDNELEANFCRCKYCTTAFRTWVKKKYKTIERVNKAYGNVVWSGEYSSFEEIKPPYGQNSHWLNPSFMLDFNRYASNSVGEYIRFQKNIIREYSKEQWITTNTYFCENMPDFYEEFTELDMVAYDNYPVCKIPEGEEYSHAFHLDLMRGIKQKNFWIMEQLSGIVGSWADMSRTPYPGMIKGYSLQAIAHGADAVLHFRYRTAKAGAEMFWHGLIDPGNLPGRRFEEFTELCNEVKRLSCLDGSKIHNEVAILYNPEDEYAFKIQYQEKELYYFQAIKAFHSACTSLGVGVDVIHNTAELEEYKVVIAPTMFVENKTVSGNLYEYTRNGGVLILTYRSGVKDENNVCMEQPLPSIFSELSGCYVTEYDGLGGDTGSIQDYTGSHHEITIWAELLKPVSAKVLAVYEEEFYKGIAAITENKYDLGTCYYLGCVGKSELYRFLVEEAFKKAGVKYRADLPKGIEITRRETETAEYYFYFNNSNAKVEISLESDHAKSLYEFGTEHKIRQCDMKPFEMRIYYRKKVKL